MAAIKVLVEVPEPVPAAQHVAVQAVLPQLVKRGWFR